jgi:hypothetical protein
MAGQPALAGRRARARSHAQSHGDLGRRVPDDDPDQPVAKVIDLDSARIRRNADRVRKQQFGTRKIHARRRHRT